MGLGAWKSRHTDFLVTWLRASKLYRTSVGEVRTLIAKFHYTDPTRTRPDPHGPARTFFAAKLRWVRPGPVGSV